MSESEADLTPPIPQENDDVIQHKGEVANKLDALRRLMDQARTVSSTETDNISNLEVNEYGDLVNKPPKPESTEQK